MLMLAVLAGISIALGGLVFLSVDNKVIGAALFTVGLFTVCTFGLNLREAGGVPCLNPRRGLTLLSPVCRDPAIGV